MKKNTNQEKFEIFKILRKSAAKPLIKLAEIVPSMEIQ